MHAAILPPAAYQDAADLRRAQVALMHWTRQAGPCNYWHKGDIRHRIFSGGYQHQPEDLFYSWLDADGQVVGLLGLYLETGMFDLHVAPELRYTDQHAAMFQWAEARLLATARRLAQPLKQLTVDSMGCDPRYAAFLAAQGYQHSAAVMTLTEHDLTAIPAADLPAGFRFHDATAADLEQLAAVHNFSFTNKWTAELYGQVFNAPLMEAEIVVVAPDGRFAAFTNVWLDEINHSLLFEPVGTHSEFRRRGLGKALLSYVLARMQAERGIERAYVCHALASENPAAAALYQAVGFRPKYTIHDYVKPAPEA